jgi:predicted RNase H-like HicB family nuclease
MNDFDPHAYTIVVKRTKVDGEHVFVAFVRELPDLVAYEPTYRRAYDLTIKAIESLHRVATEEGRPFPAPDSFQREFSGRVTLRLPIALHRRAATQADANSVSLNAYLTVLIAEGCERGEQTRIAGPTITVAGVHSLAVTVTKATAISQGYTTGSVGLYRGMNIGQLGGPSAPLIFVDQESEALRGPIKMGAMQVAALQRARGET